MPRPVGPQTPAAWLPRPGGIGQRPAFDAAQVAALLRASGARPDAVAAFASRWQFAYSRPL